MIDMMRLLILVTLTLGLPQARALGAEPLPPRALARIGDHCFYHGPGIRCAVLSADGSRAASTTSDSTIVLWDAATGERLRELRVPQGSIYRLAFSPDGKRLAAAYDSLDEKYGVVLFDVETGQRLRSWGNFQHESYLQFSANGRQLRVSEWNGPVSVWDAATGKQLRLWKQPLEVPLKGDKRSTCGSRGVMFPNGKVVVWEMEHFINNNTTMEGSVGWRVHDADTDKLLYQKKFDPRQTNGPKTLAFSADGKRCFARDYGYKLTVWETATGKELATLEIPGLVRFALAPDGRHAVIEEAALYEKKSRLRWWDIEIGKPLRELYSDFENVRDGLQRALPVFSANGKNLLIATDSTLRLFDAQTGKERTVSGHRAAVTPRFSADGQTLFTSCHERRCRWDVSSASKPAPLTHERRKAWEVGCLAHSADERLFLDYAKQRFRVRETATGRVLSAWNLDVYTEVSALFSLDASHVLLCGGADPSWFQLYDAKTGKVSGTIGSGIHPGKPVFAPNRRLLAWADRADGVHLHDAVTGKIVRTLRSSRPLPETEFDNAVLLFSPDSEYVIERWTTLLPMRVFQISSGREIACFYANSEKTSSIDPLSCMACSPDGRLLAVAAEGSGRIRLIEIASGQVRAEFAGHRHGVHGLAFAPNGQTLASGGEDNVVFLWDVIGARTLTAANRASESDLAARWSDLAADDGKRAGVAVATLIRTPDQSVAFLQQRLRPAEILDEKRLAQRLADLDSDAFETRETASRELAQLGERAEAALRRALNNRPTLEVRRRIEDLLDKFPGPPPAETLRMLRAIEVLEHIGTPAARRCLETLAKGAADARPTHAANAALQRQAKRP